MWVESWEFCWLQWEKVRNCYYAVWWWEHRLITTSLMLSQSSPHSTIVFKLFWNVSFQPAKFTILAKSVNSLNLNYCFLIFLACQNWHLLAHICIASHYVTQLFDFIKINQYPCIHTHYYSQDQLHLETFNYHLIK